MLTRMGNATLSEVYTVARLVDARAVLLEGGNETPWVVAFNLSGLSYIGISMYRMGESCLTVHSLHSFYIKLVATMAQLVSKDQ